MNKSQHESIWRLRELIVVYIQFKILIWFSFYRCMNALLYMLWHELDGFYFVHGRKRRKCQNMRKMFFGAKFHKSKWGLICSIWPGLMTELVIYKKRLSKYVQGLEWGFNGCSSAINFLELFWFLNLESHWLNP